MRRANRFFIFQECLGRCSSKLTISAFLEIVYHWVHEQPLHSAAKTTGHSTKTICVWYNLCREVTQREFEKREKMGRRGNAVQIDECLLQGKRKSNKGRYRLSDHPYEKIENSTDENLSLRNYGSRLSGGWIFGLVERIDEHRRDARFFQVSKRDRSTLEPIILHEVETGATVFSDCWLAYTRLNDLGFIHSTVNHSENFVDPNDQTNTQMIEAIWTRLRLKIVKQMKTSPLLESHLAEHWYRLYYKSQNLFDVFLGHIKDNYSNNILQMANH